MIEQNVFNSLKISDRGYVMENGRIMLSGTGLELLENPHIRKTYLGLQREVASYALWVARFTLRVSCSGLRGSGYGLQIPDCGLQNQRI